MPPSWLLPPLECCLRVRPIQAPNSVGAHELCRDDARARHEFDELATACTWITRLARSTPTRTACPRVIFCTDFPFHWLQIDDFEHHQAWRFVAVARRW